MAPLSIVRPGRLALVLVTVLGAAGLGCGGGGGGDGGPRDKVIVAWKQGGLEVSALTAAKVDVGADCQTGTASGVDVLLCAFPAEADAKAAEDKALAWVGETTGAAQARGKVLIAVADRRKADPSGRTINQLLKLAPK